MREDSLAKLIYQILDGGFRYQDYKFQQPLPQELYIGETIYDEVLKKSILLGSLTEGQLLEQYRQQHLRSEEKEAEIKKLPETLQFLQLELYNAFLLCRSLEKQRKSIENCKKRLNDIYFEKNSLLLISAESSARFAKNQYIACIGCGLDYYDTDGSLARDLCEQYVLSLIDDEILRRIVNDETWRRYWTVEKDPEKLFNTSVLRLCHSQASLINWSKFYDSIREHPERPVEEVILDCDLLDGWLVAQDQKRKEEEKEKQGDKFARFGDEAEVFIPVYSPEEADRVDNLNTVQSKQLKTQRLRVIQKAGMINEEDMPDSKRKIRMQAQQLRMRK